MFMLILTWAFLPPRPPSLQEIFVPSIRLVIDPDPELRSVGGAGPTSQASTCV